MKDYGYEGTTGGETKDESIDDILKSIRGLVYPDRGAFREPVVDLNRPVREEPDVTMKEVQAPAHAPAVSQEKDEKQPMAAAVHAVSSFIHVVRGAGDANHAPDLQHAVNAQSFSATPAKESLGTPDSAALPTSVSLETFLRQAIEPALFAQLGKVLDSRLQELAGDKMEGYAQAFLEKWLGENAHVFMEKWLAENAPSLVVRCVEVYLKQITKACSPS